MNHQRANICFGKSKSKSSSALVLEGGKSIVRAFGSPSIFLQKRGQEETFSLPVPILYVCTSVENAQVPLFLSCWGGCASTFTLPHRKKINRPRSVTAVVLYMYRCGLACVWHTKKKKAKSLHIFLPPQVQVG